MPRRPLKVFHTSDVHLESDTFGCGDQGAAFRRRIQRAFVRVVDLAQAEAADILLIAGDLFDSNRVPEAGVEFVSEQLARLSCPVVLIPGNHDCFDHRSIYKRIDFADAGRHIHTLTEENGRTLVFPELETTVWGKGLVEHDPSYRPLAGVPQRTHDYWHIGMAHGYFAEEGEAHRSSPVTPLEIERSGLDYLAMGHVHVFTDLSQGATTACYPGTPAPLYIGVHEGGSVAVIRLDPENGVSLVERKVEIPIDA